MSWLLVGVGNPLRGDDAAGLAALERLSRLVPGARTLRLEVVPPDLGERWALDERVLVLDAAAAAPAAALAGRVRRYDLLAGPLPARVEAGPSCHGFGLAEALALARVLGRTPRGLVVYAIEGASFELGAGLSAAAERGVEEAVARALREVAGVACPPPPPRGAP